MKKIIVSILCIFLFGCQSTKQEDQLSSKEVGQMYTIEDGSKLHIAVEDERYGEAIIALWNKVYPQHTNAVSYSVITAPQIYQKFIDTRMFPYDLVWAKDTYLFSFASHGYEMEESFFQDLAIGVPSHYYKQSPILYVPMRAEGMLFAYKKDQLQALGLEESVMESFENMFASKQEKMYFHTNYAYHVDTLLTSSFSLFEDGKIAGFDTKEFKKSLELYKELYQEGNLRDDNIGMNDYFMNGEYISGLVGTWMSFEGQNLRFQKMPTYQGKQFTPIAHSYGYFINKDTLYPQAAKALLQLLRSQEGMQAYLETSNSFAVLEEKGIEQLTFQNDNQKEISYALQYSRPQQIWGQYHNPTTNFYDIYFKTSILEYIHQYINDDIKLKTVLEEIEQQEELYRQLGK
ncbi:MAG: extracellular solute-binding protein [Erysipelotrichaceae bacterium]|nr:extracellular solute-binding protein [Erysipelotrichaceae bacterium]